MKRRLMRMRMMHDAIYDREGLGEHTVHGRGRGGLGEHTVYGVRRFY